MRIEAGSESGECDDTSNHKARSDDKNHSERDFRDDENVTKTTSARDAVRLRFERDVCINLRRLARRRNPEQVEITSGLRPGDRVVTSSYAAFEKSTHLIVN